MPYPHIINEEELKSRIAGGDKAAFSSMYIKYEHRLKWFIHKTTGQDADDIIQDVFAAIWEKRHVLANVIFLEAYLYTVARNELLHAERQREFRKRTFFQYVEMQQVSWENVSRNIIFKFLHADYYKAIGSLPEKCREVFELHVTCGLSNVQIARKLGISHQAVSKHLAKGREHTGKYLEQYADTLIKLAIISLLSTLIN